MEKKVILNSLSHRPIGLLFFFSGMAGLVMQVVWMYKLGLVFGNASYAAAATLASFFLGLALGGKYWGSRSSKVIRPLRLYGLLELGIALSALLLIPGLKFYEDIYSDVVLLAGDSRSLLTLIKFFFSLLVLFVPTVLMGGTFPVLSQFIGRTHLASRGTLLYTLNTLGAAVGTFLAGFFLFIQLGVQNTYIVSICLAGIIGIMAIILDLYTEAPPSTNQPSQANPKTTSVLSITQFHIIAFGSGMLALAAETAWIKMFTQVLQNSVYSFSIVLVVFLLSLAIGGAFAHYLVKRSFKIQNIIFFLLLFSILLVGSTPWVFDFMTNGLSYVGMTAAWTDYLISIFFLSLGVIGIPAIVLGTLFPYLIKSNSIFNLVPGTFIGRMVFLNSLGSAVGPILLGFVLIEVVGVWVSIKVIAIGYGVLLFYFLKSSGIGYSSRKITVSAFATVAVLFFSSPQVVRLSDSEQLLGVWQSVDGIVSVVKSDNNIDMRLNNTYILGDAQSTLVEQMQANIPLLIHPEPEQVLFLGMGTGITAGAALNHDVKHVDVAEIVADVIPASKNFFSAWTNDLYTDHRVKIIHDDARNHLLGTKEKYDVIIGDLFSPWHSGTGSLYTLEHFQMVRSKLDSGGLFAQWLPLYQLTQESFESIVATFSKVFPTTTFWRADFSSEKPSIALIGQRTNTRLRNEVLLKNIENVLSDEKNTSLHMAGLFYLGNIEAIRSTIENAPINTDDKRTIEFIAPVATQQANAGKATFLTGPMQAQLYHNLRKVLPNKDPYLVNMPAQELSYIEVGHLYFNYLLLQNEDVEKADSILMEIRTLAPDFL
ncbi:fused MFS/spermidine synthase [Ekhidna sp.]|uniref:fused MFS/spermidine synthase n=1 Tax=Ekhidna sp. TaxID=2608089 RepID=UPI003B5B85DB